MTPEEKSLLERTYKLAEENNSMIRSMRRSARISNIMRAAYWAVILIVSFGAYYLIQPYLETMIGVYDQVQTGAQGFRGDIGKAQEAANALRDLLR